MAVLDLSLGLVTAVDARRPVARSEPHTRGAVGSLFSHGHAASPSVTSSSTGEALGERKEKFDRGLGAERKRKERDNHNTMGPT